MVPRTSSKTRKLCRVDHSAACQVREHGSAVTCKTTLSVRKFTDRIMDTGSFLITASNPILLHQRQCFTLRNDVRHSSKQKSDVKRKWWRDWIDLGWITPLTSPSPGISYADMIHSSFKTSNQPIKRSAGGREVCVQHKARPQTMSEDTGSDKIQSLLI